MDPAVLEFLGVRSFTAQKGKPITVQYVVRDAGRIDDLNVKYFGDVSTKDLHSVLVTPDMLEAYQSAIAMVESPVFGGEIATLQRLMERRIQMETQARLRRYHQDRFALRIQELA